MPGTSAGLNHSRDIHVCGRSRMPRACSSSYKAPRQSSSQVSSTVTLRLLRRCLSNCSSDSFSQAYFRRGIGIQKSPKMVPGWCHRIPPTTTAEPSRRAVAQWFASLGQKLTHSQSQRHFCFDFPKRHKVPREVPRTNGFGPAFRKQNFPGLHVEWTERIERTEGQSSPANPTTQCRSKLSPRNVSQKREYLGIWPETFGKFSLRLLNLVTWRPRQ